MSDTTINLCGNILLKSVKCIFLVIPKFWDSKKSAYFSRGSEFISFFKIGILEIVKNRFR